MPVKILIVNDEPDLESLIRHKFREKICAQQLQLCFAGNGREALRKLALEPGIDIVITDINIPKTDGINLITKIHNLYPLIKTIAISAYGDMISIRKAMNVGAFDFITKPLEFQDVEITVRKAINYVQQLKENLRLQAEKEERLRQSELFAREKVSQLEITLQDLQRTQSQLIQTEKLSSLGQLLAGVAHEINNPVNFIYGNLSYAKGYTRDLLNLVRLYQKRFCNCDQEIENFSAQIDLNFIMEDLPKMMSSMSLGAERIRQIVLTLRNFSRVDEVEMRPMNIHEGIDSTLLILQNRFKSRSSRSGVEIIKNYGNLPLVTCYPGQLSQVFMNIISNAIDALETYNEQKSLMDIQAEPSLITISTSLLNSAWVRISIKDNGPGIPENIKRRLFDPFFTTKPPGEGTGLGLSISYQIVVDKHGGKLDCISHAHQGAEFVIDIPVSQVCMQRLQLENNLI